MRGMQGEVSANASIQEIYLSISITAARLAPAGSRQEGILIRSICFRFYVSSGHRCCK